MKAILKHRVNSGNAKASNGHVNPEPSQEYTLGRCRDYRRGQALLITGIERPTPCKLGDDIVQSLRNNGNNCFRFVYRFDGQPVLASAITPYKGTNTLSHFVKLNERA